MADDDETPDMLWLGSEFKRKRLPRPPDLNSNRIKATLSKCLLRPETVAPSEVRELAAAVVYHLTSHHDSSIFSDLKAGTRW